MGEFSWSSNKNKKTKKKKKERKKKAGQQRKRADPGGKMRVVYIVEDVGRERKREMGKKGRESSCMLKGSE